MLDYIPDSSKFEYDFLASFYLIQSSNSSSWSWLISCWEECPLLLYSLKQKHIESRKKFSFN